MEKLTPIFADYNSTTPLCEPVLESMSTWGHVGNMASGHQLGQRMRGVYDDASDLIKQLLNAYSFSLYSCSSASEANQWFFYAMLNGIKGRPRVIISSLEHPCVSEPLKAYANQGLIDLVICRVNEVGQLDLAHFTDLLTPNTRLVSIMLASNDIGVILPLAEVCQKAHRVGAIVHSDIVQAVGKYPLDLDSIGVDAVSLSAHKCYAPTGFGLLMVKDKARLKPMILGGMQQEGLRAGTVHVMGMHLFSKGLAYCHHNLNNHVNVHDWAINLCNTYSFLSVVVPLDGLWNTVPLQIKGYEGHDAMMRLDLAGICVSTGSACSTGAVYASPSILALGIPPHKASQVIRLSFGYPTTEEDLAFVEKKLGEFKSF